MDHSIPFHGFGGLVVTDSVLTRTVHPEPRSSDADRAWKQALAIHESMVML
jgi:hypothetical protein